MRRGAGQRGRGYETRYRYLGLRDLEVVSHILESALPGQCHLNTVIDLDRSTKGALIFERMAHPTICSATGSFSFSFRAPHAVSRQQQWRSMVVPGRKTSHRCLPDSSTQGSGGWGRVT